MPEAAPRRPVALVTGAARRVGRAIALELARAGADLAVHYRASSKEADLLVLEIRGLGGRAEAFRADLAQPAECGALVRDAVRELGGIDWLIHSASSFHRARLEETTDAIWESSLNVNARAAFLLAREAAAGLRERAGRVVLISDFLAADPARAYFAHSVSKSAVVGLVRALAVALAPEVSVNGVAPGTVLLPEGTSEEEGDRYASKVPLRRNGSPQDVARAVLFLCTGPAFLTGQVVRVDGGKSIT